MRRKFEFEGDDLNIWVAFTDLMSNSFLIINLFLITSLLINTATSKSSNGELKKSNTPPIIFLRDSGAIRFKSGSAGLQGQQMLQEFGKAGGLIEAIENNAKLYGINLVEIIGHTDLQPIGSVASNLDKNLFNIANNIDIDRATADSLVAGSNADLGLMRAVEIMRILRYYQGNNKRLQGLEFRAYSAAQLVPPKLSNNEKPKDDDKRRIEIRFTRLDENNAIRR